MADKEKKAPPSPLAQRIRQVRKNARLTQVPFGERLGVTQGHIADVERGRSTPSGLLLRSIWREFFVNEQWLRTGEGPMYELPERLDYALARTYAKLYLEVRDALGSKMALLEDRKPGDPAVPALLEEIAADLRGQAGIAVAKPKIMLRVLTLHDARKSLTPQEIKESWAELPLVAEAAAAGEPLLVPGDEVEGWLLAPKRWVKHEGYACVRVRGRSMLPVLGDGDIVAVNLDRRDPHDLQGKMAAIRVPDEGVTVKYLQLVDETLWLFAPNIIEWRPKPYKASDIQIIGAVEWAWRRFE